MLLTCCSDEVFDLLVLSDAGRAIPHAQTALFGAPVSGRTDHALLELLPQEVFTEIGFYLVLADKPPGPTRERDHAGYVRPSALDLCSVLGTSRAMRGKVLGDKRLLSIVRLERQETGHANSTLLELGATSTVSIGKAGPHGCVEESWIRWAFSLARKREGLGSDEGLDALRDVSVSLGNHLPLSLLWETLDLQTSCDRLESVKVYTTITDDDLTCPRTPLPNVQHLALHHIELDAHSVIVSLLRTMPRLVSLEIVGGSNIEMDDPAGEADVDPATLIWLEEVFVDLESSEVRAAPVRMRVPALKILRLFGPAQGTFHSWTAYLGLQDGSLDASRIVTLELNAYDRSRNEEGRDDGEAVAGVLPEMSSLVRLVLHHMYDPESKVARALILPWEEATEYPLPHLEEVDIGHPVVLYDEAVMEKAITSRIHPDRPIEALLRMPRWSLTDRLQRLFKKSNVPFIKSQHPLPRGEEAWQDEEQWGSATWKDGTHPWFTGGGMVKKGEDGAILVDESDDGEEEWGEETSVPEGSEGREEGRS